MNYKKMREYTHEEFVELVSQLDEEQIKEFSSSQGGNPVFMRMALDPNICHIPIIQTGSAVIIRNEDNQILLQERTDRDIWGLPGGCQNIGEDLRDTAAREVLEETGINLDPLGLELIDTISGYSRRNTYPNGDIVYNNTSLYVADISLNDITTLKGDTETKRLMFFDLDNLPNNLMDQDLIAAYNSYTKRKHL